jgi:hypothetical protein
MLLSRLLLDLLLEDALERHGVGGELGDAFAQLLDRHLLLVKVEAERGLVVNVRLLLNVEAARLRCVELLGDRVFGVVQSVEQSRLFSTVSGCASQAGSNLDNLPQW